MELGIIPFRLVRFEEAQVRHERSLAILRELGDRVGQARSLINLGNVVTDLGRLGEAAACLEDALSILREPLDQADRTALPDRTVAPKDSVLREKSLHHASAEHRERVSLHHGADVQCSSPGCGRS